MANEKRGMRRIEIPLDAAGIEDIGEGQQVTVALATADRVVATERVAVDRSGKAVAALSVEEPVGALRVLIGPGDANDEDLLNLQTLERTVPKALWREKDVRLTPIVIPPFHWRWWRRWCRTFTVTGRLVCADGSAVPGAKVCAYDVDWFWWWWSSQQIGCTETDANGAFTLTFRWCCGWWPWWWWRIRHWQLEPTLIDQIRAVLPHVRLPRPNPMPSLDVFESLLAGPDQPPTRVGGAVDAAAITSLRERLLARLPEALHLERLRLWPWWPWAPWWDCAPDLIFRATQECGGETRVIVDESVFQARFDVPTQFDVTLVADERACCIKDTPPPEGNCVVISSVCGDTIDHIGGNPLAPAAPVGYLNPGFVAPAGDRPFAGGVSIDGLFGAAANVDYYELEQAATGAGPWSAVPPAAAVGVRRVYWGPQLPNPGGIVGFHPVDFTFQPIGSRLVVESREHFETNNVPASWGTSRFWVSNRDRLLGLNTNGVLPDGTYHFRLAGYAAAGGGLGPQQILPLCDTEAANALALTFDNSTGTLQPEADIVDVRINGQQAGPCSNIDATKGGKLEIDFVAYDEDAHLGYYSLIATFGKNESVDLLMVLGGVLSAVPLGLIPAADFEGPDYGAALGQGAPSPQWRCGGLRLTIDDVRKAFPKTCCYQLELRVRKRTVVDCSHEFTPGKDSNYSFTVVV